MTISNLKSMFYDLTSKHADCGAQFKSNSEQDFDKLDPYYGEVDFESVGKEEWVIQLPPGRSKFLSKCRMCANHNQKCGCVLMTMLHQLAKVTKKGQGRGDTSQSEGPRCQGCPFRDEPRVPSLADHKGGRQKKKSKPKKK